MKNIALKQELKDILANVKNISKVAESEIGDASIEIEYIHPYVSETYVYPSVAARDEELIKLRALIKEANEKNQI